jgi:Na+/phosphate symporter
LPYRNTNKIKDLAAWLIVAIKENHQLPEAVTEALAKEEEVRKAQAKKEAQEARQRDEQARRAAYFDFLRVRAAEVEKKQPAAYKSFLADTTAKRSELERDPTQKGQAKKILLRIFDDEESQLERFKEYFNEPTLEDWHKIEEARHEA